MPRWLAGECGGPVLTAEDAHAAIDAAASCLVSPVLGTEVGEVARKRDVAWMPGIATPTEAYAAHQAGAPLCRRSSPCLGLGLPGSKPFGGPCLSESGAHPRSARKQCGFISESRSPRGGLCAVGLRSQRYCRAALAQDQREGRKSLGICAPTGANRRPPAQ